MLLRFVPSSFCLVLFWRRRWSGFNCYSVYDPGPKSLLSSSFLTILWGFLEISLKFSAFLFQDSLRFLKVSGFLTQDGDYRNASWIEDFLDQFTKLQETSKIVWGSFILLSRIKIEKYEMVWAHAAISVVMDTDSSEREKKNGFGSSYRWIRGNTCRSPLWQQSGYQWIKIETKIFRFWS